MNFYLVDGEVRFLTHKVKYKGRVTEFYDVEKKNTFIANLQERNIDYVETEIKQPSQDIINKVEGKKFNTIAEAQAYIDGTNEPTKDEIIQSMALAIATLDAELQALKEGVSND